MRSMYNLFPLWLVIPLISTSLYRIILTGFSIPTMWWSKPWSPSIMSVLYIYTNCSDSYPCYSVETFVWRRCRCIVIIMCNFMAPNIRETSMEIVLPVMWYERKYTCGSKIYFHIMTVYFCTDKKSYARILWCITLLHLQYVQYFYITTIY